MVVKIIRVLWKDNLNGKALVKIEELHDSKKLVGIFDHFQYEIGITLEIDGIETDNPKYGPTIEVTRYTLVLTTEAAGIEFLQCGLGLRLIDAQKVVTYCKGNIKNLLKEGSIAALQNIGFTELKAFDIVDKIRSTLIQQELLEFLYPYNHSYNISRKIYKEYEFDSIKVIKEDPYMLLNYGFKLIEADKMAKDLGFDADDDRRIDAIVRSILKVEKSCGHTYANIEDIFNGRKYLKNEVFPNTITNAMIVAHIAQKGIRNDHDLIYFNSMFQAELNTAKQIQRLNFSGSPLPFNERFIDESETQTGLKYAPQQREAFSLLKKTGVGILTGGPGTGKSTVINGILMAYEKMKPGGVIRLCAPTGRAAQRITETTGREAVTIHRLLEYKPFGREMDVQRNASNPIEADIIIVDESSMLDIELASLFFSAVGNGTLVILVGDINQLPSVGAGDVLHDLITSGVVPVVQLTTVYRQAETSPIIANARAINAGIDNLIQNEDFVINKYQNDADIADAIIEYMQNNYDSTDPFGIQVLVPSRVGKAGLTELNSRLQEVLNPGRSGVQYGRTCYRENDKVIFTRNNYDAGYFNGDIGVVTEARNGQLVIKFQGKDDTVIISKELLEDVTLAYAMTIHKSQGSEFPEAIVVMPQTPVTMLKRNLLYTGITRAKKKVWLVSAIGSVRRAVSNTDTGKRRTKLTERLQNNGYLKEDNYG